MYTKTLKPIRFSYGCIYIYDIVCTYSMYIVYYYILLYGDIYYELWCIYTNWYVLYMIYIYMYIQIIYIHYIYTIYIYISTLYIYYTYYIYLFTISIYIYICIISHILLPRELPHRPPRSAGWRSTRWSSRWFRCRRCWCALDLAVPLAKRSGADGFGSPGGGLHSDSNHGLSDGYDGYDGNF